MRLCTCLHPTRVHCVAKCQLMFQNHLLLLIKTPMYLIRRIQVYSNTLTRSRSASGVLRHISCLFQYVVLPRVVQRKQSEQAGHSPGFSHCAGFAYHPDFSYRPAGEVNVCSSGCLHVHEASLASPPSSVGRGNLSRGKGHAGSSQSSCAC